MLCDQNSSVPDWVIEYPQTLVVFQELQFEVTCEGKSVEYLAIQKGISPADVIERLHRQISLDH